MGVEVSIWQSGYHNSCENVWPVIGPEAHHNRCKKMDNLDTMAITEIEKCKS